MRQITIDAIRAFRNGRNFKRGNTQVVVDKAEDGNNWRGLRLHGSTIAEMDSNGDLFLNTHGYLTVTTKERLNGFPSVHIVQKNFEWFLNGEKWDGGRIRVNW
jgi:hypothetical protein